MQTKKKRTIPFAAVVSLTFGTACGDDDKGPPTAEDLGEIGADFAAVICQSYFECDPEEFSEDFGDVEQCEEAYKEYYSEAYFKEVLDDEDDPDACAEALAKAFDCYLDLYSGLSCEDFDDFDDEEGDGPCEAEETALERDCPKFGEE